jgi:hypothetical protein
LPKLVSTVNTKVLSNVFSRLSPKRDPPKLPVFQEIIPEVHEVHEEHEEHEESEQVVINMEHEIVPESITPHGETVSEIVDTLVEDTVKSSGTISDDLEELRSKGLVSKRP